MDETVFHRLTKAFFTMISDALEEADAQGIIELESQEGVMSVSLPGGRQYVLSKHAPTRQLWLSSPVSGGLHFSYSSPCGEEGRWILPDGRRLEEVLAQELRMAGVEVRIDGTQA